MPEKAEVGGPKGGLPRATRPPGVPGSCARMRPASPDSTHLVSRILYIDKKTSSGYHAHLWLDGMAPVAPTGPHRPSGQYTTQFTMSGEELYIIIVIIWTPDPPSGHSRRTGRALARSLAPPGLTASAPSAPRPRGRCWRSRRRLRHRGSRGRGRSGGCGGPTTMAPRAPGSRPGAASSGGGCGGCGSAEAARGCGSAAVAAFTAAGSVVGASASALAA